MAKEENENRSVGFPSDMAINLYWLGQNPKRAIAEHIRDLVRQRYKDGSLLKVACTAPPLYRTKIKSTEGAST
ncbi:MAG: hypothetical protein R6U43_02410 [Candidatus Krumholzibacteriales bacterium]